MEAQGDRGADGLVDEPRGAERGAKILSQQDVMRMLDGRTKELTASRSHDTDWTCGQTSALANVVSMRVVLVSAVFP